MEALFIRFIRFNIYFGQRKVAYGMRRYGGLFNARCKRGKDYYV